MYHIFLLLWFFVGFVTPYSSLVPQRQQAGTDNFAATFSQCKQRKRERVISWYFNPSINTKTIENHG
jgi:hypothetical protein